MSHILQVLSPEAVNTCLPSGPNDSYKTTTKVYSDKALNPLARGSQYDSLSNIHNLDSTTHCVYASSVSLVTSQGPHLLPSLAIVDNDNPISSS